MREFVVLGHDAPLSPDFSLDDLAGGAGRLDVLCRCVTSALCLSHGIREDVRVWLVLGDEFAVCFDGSAVRNLNPDERSTAALVKTALEAKEGAIGHMAAESSPGVSIVRFGFEDLLDEMGGTLVELHENGDPVGAVEPPLDPVFVLSDHREFSDSEAALLETRATERIRLGPERLHANHAITVAHNWLDTSGYVEY